MVVAKPDTDNSIRNIRVSHSCISGGHGLTFIPWGTDNPDLSKQEITDIVAYDNIISGGYSVGTWCDNHTMGKILLQITNRMTTPLLRM